MFLMPAIPFLPEVTRVGSPRLLLELPTLHFAPGELGTGLVTVCGCPEHCLYEHEPWP